LLIGAREDDDAAVWKAEPGLVVGTTDTMVEGTDFRSDWPGLTLRLLGRRLMSINLSDLAAMGAQPRHALISLCLPGALSMADVTELYRGISERAQQFECTIAGGDLSATTGPLTLTAALYGVIRPGTRPMRRLGARPGWALAVTGVIGRAAAGRVWRRRGQTPRTPAERRWIMAQLDPAPRVEAGQILSESGIRVAGDISDGLYREIERLLEREGLGAMLDADRLPLDADIRRGHPDAWSSRLMESEDYELICAASPAALRSAGQRLKRRYGLTLTIIGEVTREPGIRARVDGRLRPITSHGYEHFR
jgi:thiamine-monophosphate kinase